MGYDFTFYGPYYKQADGTEGHLSFSYRSDETNKKLYPLTFVLNPLDEFDRNLDVDDNNPKVPFALGDDYSAQDLFDAFNDGLSKANFPPERASQVMFAASAADKLEYTLWGNPFLGDVTLRGEITSKK